MRCVAKAGFGIVVAALACCNGVAQSPKKATPKTAQEERARKAANEESTRIRRIEVSVQILEDVHAAAQELPLDQRVTILKEVCDAAATFSSSFEVHSSTDPVFEKLAGRVREWSEELSRTADELNPHSPEKLSAQVSAVSAIVTVDEKRALVMLDGLDSPNDEKLEPLRDLAARTVFIQLMMTRGDSAVPDIRKRADALGQAGRYPFEAIGNVIGEIENVGLAREVFGDALQNFESAEDSLLAASGMAVILSHPAVPQRIEPSQIREATQGIAARLTSALQEESRRPQEGKPVRSGFPIVYATVRRDLAVIDPEMAATVPEPPPFKAPAGAQPRRDSVNPKAEKLLVELRKTTTALAGVEAHNVHEGTELEQLIGKGIQQSSAIAHTTVEGSTDYPEALEEAMDHVSDCIQMSGRLNPAMTLAALRKEPNAGIRARMLLELVEALQTQVVRRYWKYAPSQQSTSRP